MDFKSFKYQPKRLEKKSMNRKNRINTLSYLLSFVFVLNIADFIIKSNETVKYYSDYSYSSIELEKNILSEEPIQCESADFITLELPEVFENIDEIDDVVERALIVSNGVREMVKDIPNSVKLEYIYNHYKCDQYIFNIIKSVSCREGKLGNYDDAFATITSIYNRMRSYKKCGYARIWLNKSGPISLYDHIIAEGQYEVYEKKTYMYAWNDFESDSFQAIIDFLYVADREGVPFMHNFMDFYAAPYVGDGRIQFVRGGNNYFHELVESDIIPFDERYYYDEESLYIDESPRLIIK